jgi:hypothetical protein
MPNIHEIIETWWQKLIYNTIIQTDEVLHNKFYAAKEELKQQLAPTSTVEQSIEEK